MSASNARRGRRDNGLDAAEFAVVGDVDPRVGEHLLDVLAVGGIAAYLQPAADLNPVTRTTTMPPRPTDRLYVDRTHLGTARDYLARLTDEAEAAGAGGSVGGSGAGGPRFGGADGSGTGGPATPYVEAEWARIVASFNTEPSTADRRWPVAEQIEAGDHPRDAPVSPPGPPAGTGRLLDRGPVEPSLLDGLDTFGADLPADDEEEGYTPPPPPPLPRLSKYAVLGVLGVVGGFVLFLSPGLLPIDRTVSLLFGFSAILAGFVTLIWRLRPGDDGDDDYDPDDGARV